MFYNRTSFMPGTRTHRRLPVSMRPLVVVLLGVCLATTDFSRTSAAQDARQPFPRNAWTALAHGQADEAAALARAQTSDDPDAAAVLGVLAIRRGAYEEAVQLLAPAASADPLGRAALELGLLHQHLGRSEAGSALLTPLFHQGVGASDPGVVARAARAAQALGRPHDANALFRSASAAMGGDPSIDTDYARLFLERFDEPEAARRLQEVLQRDARWAPAHAALGWALADENPPAAAAAAQKAIAIDPALDSALVLLAQLDLDNARTDAARARLDTILATNPRHLEARSLLAAMAYVDGDRAAYEKAVADVLAVHPGYGEVYRVAGDLAARNYRFDEAVALARQATVLDPGSARAHGDLGMHLLRTGDEAAARQALERSFTADRFNRVTYNLLMLLDKLDNFTVVDDGQRGGEDAPGRSARAARVRGAARAGSARDPEREVSASRRRARSSSRSSRCTTTSPSATWDCPG